MTRVYLASGLVLWAGATLLLSTLRWFARVPIAERLRPYVRGGLGLPGRAGLLSVESFRDVVGPLATVLGSRVSRLFGVSEELSAKLVRVHSPLDVTRFRTRQLGWTVAAVGAAALVAVALQPPIQFVLLLLLGAPLTAFLVVEQSLVRASDRWRRRVFLELPVVVEQMAMLLSSGFSLSGALARVATRGRGAVSRDLERVVRRVRQGLSEEEALREWAEVARVPAVERLVPILALNREASDLGRLLSEEARSIRRDVQRELVELVERRGQQVWVPVTVATLLPGAIFLAVPFFQALQLFSR